MPIIALQVCSGGGGGGGIDSVTCDETIAGDGVSNDSGSALSVRPRLTLRLISTLLDPVFNGEISETSPIVSFIEKFGNKAGEGLKKGDRVVDANGTMGYVSNIKFSPDRSQVTFYYRTFLPTYSNYSFVSGDIKDNEGFVGYIGNIEDLDDPSTVGKNLSQIIYETYEDLSHASVLVNSILGI